MEFGVTTPDWAAVPLDAGTLRVLSQGSRIVYDPRGLLHSVVGSITAWSGLSRYHRRMAADWQGTAEAYADSFERLCAGTVDALFASLPVPAPGSRLLDVGTGTGTVAAAAQERGFKTDAIDSEISMLDLARRRHSDVTFVQAALPWLPYAAGSFDVVTANFVINHVPEPAAAVTEMARVCRTGGQVAVTIWPGTPSPISELWNQVVDEAMATRPDGQTLPAEKDFERSEEGLARLLREGGFEDVTTEKLDWSFAIAPDDLWRAVDGGIGNVGSIYRAQDPVTRLEMKRVFDRLSRDLVDGSEIQLPYTALLGIGQASGRDRATSSHPLMMAVTVPRTPEG